MSPDAPEIHILEEVGNTSSMTVYSLPVNTLYCWSISFQLRTIEAQAIAKKLIPNQ